MRIRGPEQSWHWPQSPGVDVVFTDDVGRRWKVYDWSVVSGRRSKRTPGDKSAEYRGFVDETSGERRVYQFATEEAPRLPSAQLLSQQLAGAQPGHPRWPYVES